MTTPTTSQPVGKQCTRCGDTKPLDCFQKDDGHTDGKQSWCHDCQVAFTRQRRARIRQDTEKYRAYLEQRREEKRRYRARKKLRELAALATAEPLPL